MKKFLSILTAVAVMCTVSCSESTPAETITTNEPRFTEDGKPIITIGTMGEIDPLFNDQMNKPKNVKIEFIDYSEGVIFDNSLPNADKVYNDAVESNFRNSLILGNIPDIFYIPPKHMQMVINLGLMTDLYVLMDEYDGLKREDFTDCALEGLTVDGKIPALMETYCINTAYAKTKYIGKEYENWTADDAMKFYNKMPEFNKDMQFCYGYDETGLTDFMLRLEGYNCIDMKNNTCDFNGKFTELLDFCKNNPVSYSDLTNDGGAPDKEDELLVYKLRINGFDSWLATQTYFYRNKDDITFVGYPSENGQGAYIAPDGNALYGITENCANKEAAWDIVCRLMKHHEKLEKNQSKHMGLSVLKKEFQKDYDRDESYVNSINANIFTGNFDEQEYLPKEVKDMFFDYIMSVPVNPYIPEKLDFIIEEEVDAAILGDRKAKDTSEILNNRISIYLSEKY